MTRFEWTYLAAEPFLPPLYAAVRRRLRRHSRALAGSARLLDVGGRKSHYTIGLPAMVTVSDVPRESELQHQLNLGFDATIRSHLELRRSNVDGVVVDDMTESHLPSGAFDIVAAVEVLEHVERDDDFLSNVQRVLRPGGVFIMTTPNGDSKPHPTGDHKRHYRGSQLEDLLRRHFERVQVSGTIVGGRARRWGLRPWSARHPLRTLRSMAGNLINRMLSAAGDATGTCHLIAECAGPLRGQ